MTNTNYETLQKEATIFAKEIYAQLDLMTKSGNPIVELDYEGDIAEVYLDNIPKEYNPIFRERRYFDGNYDKRFLRAVGKMAMITEDYKVVSLWDFESKTVLEPARKAMLEAVKECNIKDLFLHFEKWVGNEPNVDSKDNRIIWEHYLYRLPNSLVEKNDYIPTVKGKYRAEYETLSRSLKEVNIEDLTTVIDLIEYNDIYRGREFLKVLIEWRSDKEEYDKINTDEYVWYITIKGMKKERTLFKYRNSVIGSLITDLYEGKDLESAVKSYESKVAPSNYKRPKALVTTRMVDDAKAKLEELGFLDSIYRAPAKLTDIPTDKVLFTSQEVRSLSVFDDLKKDATNNITKKVNLKEAKEVGMKEFFEMLPNVRKIDLYPNIDVNSSKLVMTKPYYEDSPSPFKWDNGFSWTYTDTDSADSITQRVKNAGGNVDGEVRFSLSWDNTDDLDIILENAYTGDMIFFDRKRNLGGELDIDANFMTIMENPVENIYWNSINDMADGKYYVRVNNYTRRTNSDQGFKLQMAVLGEVVTYSCSTNEVNHHEQMLTVYKNGRSIDIIDVNEKLPKEDISGKQFIEVKNILKSPNAWSDKVIGNEHVIFLADGIEVNFHVRGFFNEQLNATLNEHRKVTEVLGSKLKLSPDKFEGDDIAKGYGFSTTSNKNFYLRLTFENGRKELIKLTK